MIILSFPVTWNLARFDKTDRHGEYAVVRCERGPFGLWRSLTSPVLIALKTRGEIIRIERSMDANGVRCFTGNEMFVILGPIKSGPARALFGKPSQQHPFRAFLRPRTKHSNDGVLEKQTVVVERKAE